MRYRGQLHNFACCHPKYVYWFGPLGNAPVHGQINRSAVIDTNDWNTTDKHEYVYFPEPSYPDTYWAYQNSSNAFCFDHVNEDIYFISNLGTGRDICKVHQTPMSPRQFVATAVFQYAPTAASIEGLDVDPRNGYIFYLVQNRGGGSSGGNYWVQDIRRVNYDGTNDISLIHEDTYFIGGATGAHAPYWLKYHDNLSRLYYIRAVDTTFSITYQLKSVQYDGSAPTLLYHAPEPNYIISLAVDTVGSHLLWAEYIPSAMNIVRANMSGGARTSIATDVWGAITNYPPKLCYSNLLNKLYLFEARPSTDGARVRRMASDGTGVQVVAGPGDILCGYISAFPSLRCMEMNSKFELGKGLENVGPGAYM